MTTVLMNPPYSLAYPADERFKTDKRFMSYPLAPKSKADLMFLLDGLSRLPNGGRMAILYPHGVLFRSSAEYQIRKLLLQQGLIDMIISMPSKLFPGTDIPTVILVLEKGRQSDQVFIVDASNHFEKEKSKNRLRVEDVKRIVDACKSKANIDKFSRSVLLQEIEENDFNLNIPRYIDTTEPKEPVDVLKLVEEVKELDDEIARTEQDFMSMLGKLIGKDAKKQAEIDAIIQAFIYEGDATGYEPIEVEQVAEVYDDEGAPTREAQQLTIEMFMNAEKSERQLERRIEQLQTVKEKFLDDMFV